MNKDQAYIAFMAGAKAMQEHKKGITFDHLCRHFEEWWEARPQAARDAPVAIPHPAIRGVDAWARDRDIATEGQRAAIYYNDLDKGTKHE